MHHNGEPARFQVLQGRDQRGLVLTENLRTQNPGKLAAQTRHAALQPVSAMLRYQGGDGVHQAGPVLADNGHYERALHNLTGYLATLRASSVRLKISSGEPSAGMEISSFRRR